MNNKAYIYSIILVAFLVQLRLIPHPPNFTPILEQFKILPHFWVSIFFTDTFFRKRVTCSTHSFSKFFSIWLHELSHSFSGSDGSRTFSDALTYLIQKCIDNHTSVKKYSNQWSKLVN